MDKSKKDKKDNTSKEAKKGEVPSKVEKEEAIDVGENPYVSVISKKIRGLNKKLEKVKATETAMAEGKVRKHILCFVYIDIYLCE